MVDRPILMSGPLVVATLAGRKTQTRRIVTPATSIVHGWPSARAIWHRLDLTRAESVILRRTSIAKGEHVMPHPGLSVPIVSGDGTGERVVVLPRIRPGDRLWVRESWCTTAEWNDISPSRMRHMALAAGYDDAFGPVKYAAGGEMNADLLGPSSSFGSACGRWRPSIHMPRWASRLTLAVDAVRAERVQDISEDDARAEGVDPWPHSPDQWDSAHTFRFGDAPHKGSFYVLWDEINGRRPGCSCADNPWTWAIQYHVER